MITSTVRFLNIVIAALLAGVSFGIWIGFNPSRLSIQTYVEQQQNMLHSLRILMVVLVVIATLITILSAYLQRRDKYIFTSLCVAALFFIACILITLLGNKPIDEIILTWTKESVPDNWDHLRDTWWSLHVLRTIAEILALFLITWTSIKKGEVNSIAFTKQE